MIPDNRMETFLDLMEPDNTPFLEELSSRALREDVPIIRRSMQSFIKFLLELHKPMRILEVGTAVGFSSLLMREYGQEDLEIITIERDPERASQARENIAAAIAEDEAQGRKRGSITILEGDAFEILPTIEGRFDLIFMDAAKGQYINWLPTILALLPEGGLLLTDNILQDGDVLESRFAVRRRDRTIHARMRDYIYELKNHPQLTTTLLPVGDGAALSIKR